MKTPSPMVQSGRLKLRAFSLIEVLMGVIVVAIAVISLYAGISTSFTLTKAAREDLRATQILLERMEGIRLYNWDQLVYSNMIPTKFTTSYYPLALSGQSTGITYYGTMTITNAVLSPPATYASQMRSITATVYWTNYPSGNMDIPVVRSRTMTTYTARDGVQNYVYNN